VLACDVVTHLSSAASQHRAQKNGDKGRQQPVVSQVVYHGLQGIDTGL
jgi:hypothetical protein